jgi:chaperone modulatory protein CbpM
MSKSTSQSLSFQELCLVTELPSQTIVQIVEQGIIEPVGDGPEDWVFSTHMITVTKKACRLHNDLEIDWPGIALAISLIEELERLRAENRQLNNRLGRFSSGSDNPPTS